jgi:TM2 domain-containing membrane protein YozV
MTQIVTQRKEPWVAVLLSFLLAGLGQIYAGAAERGAIQLVCAVVLFFLVVLSGGIFIIFSFPFWIWVMFDAYAQVQAFNGKVEHQEWNTKNEAQQTISAKDFVAQFHKLAKLHSASLLSEEEFLSRKKQQILTLVDRKPRESTEDFLAALIPLIEQKYLSTSEVEQIKKLVFFP